jgi:hypothetical protein
MGPSKKVISFAAGPRHATPHAVSGHSTVGRSHCQNCGSPLSGPYCSSCGQHDVDYHRSLWPILEDSLEGFLHFDGKFFRTVRLLFARPGFLTKEFIAGKRVSYTQPLRLYIFASFLYFASGFFNFDQEPSATAPPNSHVANVTRESSGKAPEPPALPKAVAPSRWSRMLDKLQHEDPTEVTSELKHLTPTTVFFCIPVLALLLSLAYPKSGRVYVEHLIFALHVQAFVFLCLLVTGVLQALVGLVSSQIAGLIGLLAFFGACWLIYRAFREVYGQARWITIFKMAGVAALYGLVLIVGVALMAVAAAIIIMK